VIESDRRRLPGEAVSNAVEREKKGEGGESRMVDDKAKGKTKKVVESKGGESTREVPARREGNTTWGVNGQKRESKRAVSGVRVQWGGGKVLQKKS